MSQIELSETRWLRHVIGRKSWPRPAYSEAVFVGVLRMLDVAVIVVSAISAFFLFVQGKSVALLSLYPISTVIAVLIFLQASHIFETYAAANIRRFRLRTIALPWFVTIAFLIVGFFLLKISDEISRGWIGLFFAFGIGSLTTARLSAIYGFHCFGRAGLFTRPICVLGSGELAQRFVERVNAGAAGFHRIVGVYDDRARRSPRSLAAIKVFGTVEDLIEFARDNPVLEIVVALPLSAEERLLEIVGRLSVVPADVRVLTDFIGFHLPNRGVSHIAGVPLINVLDRPIKEWRAVGKLLQDYLGAAILGLLCLPFALIIAALIKIDSPGPVLFRQKRQGFNNRVFQMYKFRTMYDGDRDLAGNRLTTRDDPRVTRVGRLLRKFSLDELPQLLNVLNGTMSLVGPRPHALNARAGEALYDQVVVNYAARHRVKPGITGWAQINGWRGETDTPEKIQNRVKFDLHYIDNWSLMFDVEILLLTLFRGITGAHVY